MKGKKRINPIVLFIALSLAVLFSSTYSFYYPLASADFISRHPKIESFDQEMLQVCAASLKVYSLYHSSIIALHFINSLKEVSHSLCVASLLDQTVPVLRC
jgi:hypothetical protein